MSGRRVALALAALAAVPACYSGPAGDADTHCKIACTSDCPDGETCEAATGLCVAAGDSCAAPAARYTFAQAGARHACALTDSGHIDCWGDNSDGQLGITALDQTGTPTEVGDDAVTWSALAVGAEHTCGIRQRTVWCWGENQEGQVAGGSGGTIRTPMPVPLGAGAPSFDSVTAGTHHTCALGGGDAWCWGSPGPAGQTAAVDAATQVMPPASKPDAKFSALSAGNSHTCAIDNDGQVTCWGTNESGQTGQPAVLGIQAPMIVTLSTPAVKIASGAFATCAVLANLGNSAGELWCWGRNTNGMIDPVNSLGAPTLPTQIGTDADWTAVAVNEAAICGVRKQMAYCWGNSASGGLGDGYWAEMSPVPPTTPRMIGSAQGVAMSAHPPNDPDVRDELGCLIFNGDVECWGDQSDGAVGTGPPTLTSTPRPVPPPLGLTWSHVWTGTNHTCATASDGTLWCWGADYFGQVRGSIGRGMTQPCRTDEDCDEPNPIAAPPLGGAPNAPSNAIVGDDYTCVLQGTQVWCWGDDSMGDLGVPTPGGYNAVMVAATTGAEWSRLTGGSEGTCAVDAGANALECWGNYNAGTTEATPTPSAPPGTLSAAATVQLERDSSCALDGNVRLCWGENSVGEIGDGTIMPQDLPTVAETAIALLSVGGLHGCEIDLNAALRCWGSSAYGEAGPTDVSQVNLSSMPITTSTNVELGGCTAVVAGNRNSCALCSPAGGPVIPYCWGDNSLDQLGRAPGVSAPASDATEVDVPGGKTWLEISLTNNHGCVLDADGELFCWGDGGHGALGDGSQSRNIPTKILPPAM